MSYLRVCFWNANGLNQHKTEISYFMKKQNIDVMLVSETHLTNRYNFYISGYSFHSTNHPDGKAHGGTGILIRNRIRHYALDEFSKDYLQATSIHLECFSGGLTLSSVYCPPRFSMTKEKFEEFFNTLGDRFLACGDYNAKHTYWGSRLMNPRGRQLYKVLVDRKNGIDFVSPGHPTYWPADPRKIPDLIDFAISKNINRNSITTEISYDLSSDHSPIIVTYYGRTNLRNYTTNTFYRTNWLKYKKYISSHIHTNPNVQCEEDINECVNDFTSLLTSAMEHSNSQNFIKDDKITSNTEIEKLLREKRKFRREWQQTRSPAAKLRLSIASKKLKRSLQLEEDRQSRKYIESLTNNKHTNYSIWKEAKDIKPPVEAQSPLRKADGTWARSAEDKANLFACYLSTVFQPNPQTNDFVLGETLDTTQNYDDIIVVSPEDIDTIIKENINVRKSPGYDSITPSMIKKLPNVAIIVLSIIFNAILKLGVFPKIWKTSLIKMIPKPGKDSTIASSYRPISLLSCLSKLFEKVFQKKILPFLNDGNIVPVHQFGFREKHGTIEQVNRLTGEIRKCFELKKYCSAIFLDVAQAFDKVWHKGLIYKIKCLLPPCTHKLLESYLSDRIFRVKYNDFVTEEFEIKAGVPQGSVLGPTLYLIYTSDLPICDELTISTFADDTAILSSHENPQIASSQLDIYLRRVETWLKNWRIRVNEVKSNHVTFTLRRGNCPPVTLNDINIPQSDHVTYLGIHLDRRLTWRRHIEAKRLHMKLKASSLHWLINSHSKLSLDNKVILYKTVLKPIWTYGIQLWGTASNTSIDIIQRAQSKILRTMTGAPWYIRNENIHRDLEVPLVRDEFRKLREKYILKLETHPNPLARSLAEVQSATRLRRADFPPR